MTTIWSYSKLDSKLIDDTVSAIWSHHSMQNTNIRFYALMNTRIHEHQLMNVSSNTFNEGQWFSTLKQFCSLKTEKIKIALSGFSNWIYFHRTMKKENETPIMQVQIYNVQFCNGSIVWRFQFIKIERTNSNKYEKLADSLI